MDTWRAVDEHVAARSASLFRDATPPQRGDYELALYFKSQVMKKYAANPRGWLRQERDLLVADRRAGAHKKKHLQPLLPATKPAVVRPTPARVSKPEKPKSKRATVRQPPTAKMAPQPPAGVPRRASGRPASSTPEPRNRLVAPSREDKDFPSLPDYCPPLDSLPPKANSLKVDWKGNPLDLSRDPFIGLLHPDERSLAAGLRLDCATYLTSKRRIFMRRLDCAKIHKEFRKTDAQQACKIDVNKASKLWMAYEKVGWLDAKFMRRFMS